MDDIIEMVIKGPGGEVLAGRSGALNWNKNIGVSEEEIIQATFRGVVLSYSLTEDFKKLVSQEKGAVNLRLEFVKLRRQ